MVPDPSQLGPYLLSDIGTPPSQFKKPKTPPLLLAQRCTWGTLVRTWLLLLHQVTHVLRPHPPPLVTDSWSISDFSTFQCSAMARCSWYPVSSSSNSNHTCLSTCLDVLATLWIGYFHCSRWDRWSNTRTFGRTPSSVPAGVFPPVCLRFSVSRNKNRSLFSLVSDVIFLGFWQWKGKVTPRTWSNVENDFGCDSNDRR